MKLVPDCEALLAPTLTRTALDMMMVDPAYQRMGAGRLLVKWGLAEAEKMGVDVSSPLLPYESASLIGQGCRGGFRQGS